MIEHKVNFCIRCSLVAPPKQLKIISDLLSKELQRNLDLNSVDLMEISDTTNVVLPEDYTDLFCSLIKSIASIHIKSASKYAL